METIKPLMLDVPSELGTARLKLRVPRAGDGPIIAPAAQESLAELKAWMPWAKDDYGEKEAEEWARRAVATFLTRERCEYVIFARDGGRHLGNLGMFNFDWTVPRCEIGYWIRTADTGRGYASEAVGALLEMGRGLKMRRFQIQSDADNRKSRRVAERAGFELEGILRDFVRRPDQSIGSICVYSLLVTPTDSSPFPSRASGRNKCSFGA